MLIILIMELRRLFAANLRSRRKAAGMTQEDLAFRADLDRTYISSLERCRYGVSIDVIERLAKELDLEPHQLLLKETK